MPAAVVGVAVRRLSTTALAGEHNAFRLWQEIKSQGFSGGVDAVQRFVREWRKTPVEKPLCPITCRGLSPRQAAKLLLQPSAPDDEWARIYVDELISVSPQVEELQHLGRSFQEMVKERRAGQACDAPDRMTLPM